MEPKFQSSFIPKGPIATAGKTAAPARVMAKGGIVGLAARSLLGIAILLSAGVFGYNTFLSYRISETGAKLDATRSEIDGGAVRELVRLDSRIKSTTTLLEKHIVITPLLELIETSTLRSVRFTELKYETTDKGIELILVGEARGYSAVALQAEQFSKNQYLKSPVFSDLSLDKEGNVVFTFRAFVDSSLVSYKRVAEREALTLPPPAQAPAATSTQPAATSTSSTSSGQASSSQAQI